MEISISRWPPRVLPDGTTFIQHFTVRTESPYAEPRVAVEMDVEVDDLGRPQLRKISIESLDDHPVTENTLRSVPTPRLLRHATALAASSFRLKSFDSSAGTAAFDILGAVDGKTYEERFVLAKPPRKGEPDPQEIVREVRSARARGETPADAIADRWHVAPATAYRWIKKVEALLDH